MFSCALKHGNTTNFERRLSILFNSNRSEAQRPWGRTFESRKGAIFLTGDFITDRTNVFKLFYGLW